MKALSSCCLRLTTDLDPFIFSSLFPLTASFKLPSLQQELRWILFACYNFEANHHDYLLNINIDFVPLLIFFIQ